MKKFIIILILFLNTGCLQQKTSQNTISSETLPIITFVNVNKELVPLSIEVADTPQKRSLGLMYRESLPKNQGMIFIFENLAQHAFWMKNTAIPLEMLFVDENQKIVDLLHAIPCKQDPCASYKPKTTALYVIEVNEGFSSEHAISIGNTVILGDIL